MTHTDRPAPKHLGDYDRFFDHLMAFFGSTHVPTHRARVYRTPTHRANVTAVTR